MARKKIAQKTSRKLTAPSPTARQLWLAGLGLASMARRQAIATAAAAANHAAEARRQAIAVVGQAQSSLAAVAGELRGRVETGAAQFGETMETTLAPLMVKFKPKAKRAARRGRKPTVKKTVRRVANKKSVKRTRKA